MDTFLWGRKKLKYSLNHRTTTRTTTYLLHPNLVLLDFYKWILSDLCYMLTCMQQSKWQIDFER